MKEKLTLVELLFKDLLKNTKIFIKNEEKAKENCHWSESYLNKNHGKCALKRKITFLRQELLNLERMIEDENS